MFYIGCHLSVSDGYEAMGKTALSIGANTFQYFTRNPRGRGFRRPSKEDVAALVALMQEHGFAPPLAHAPYTFNPASCEARIWDYSRDSMREDLEVLSEIPGSLYNFHPGSHVGQGIDEGIRLISEMLNEILTEDMTTTVLLETMAGKGSEVGSQFEELRRIIDNVNLSHKLGVCLDTCHVNDAGYDVVNDLDGVLENFDKIIGLDRLKAIHVNDSKNPFAAHKDRHEKLGEGYIGLDAFRRIINHPALKELPFYLETPHEEISGYEKEISILKNLRK